MHVVSGAEAMQLMQISFATLLCVAEKPHPQAEVKER
jgi:hypothetical protein